MSYQALELDGNGYAAIADASQKGLNMGLSDFMLEARIKIASNPIETKCFINKGEGATNRYVVYISTSGRLRGGIADTAFVGSADDGASICDGQWQNIIIIFDRSGNLVRYVGGSSYGTATEILGEAGDIGNMGDFFIGAYTVNAQRVIGLIDCVRVWNFGKDGLPSGYADYISWRAEGRNAFLDIGDYSSGAWNGYADALRTDLLTNGDMELDANWIARGTPTTEVRSSEQANNGTYSWKIVSDATSEGAYQDITTVVGKWYEVTGYVYVTAGNAKLGKEDTDGSDQVLTGQATAAAWNEFNVIFKATETTSRIFFQSDATAASTFYVDDVKVVRTGLVSRYKFSGNYNDETTNANHLTAGGSGNSFPGYSLRSKAQKMLLGVG